MKPILKTELMVPFRLTKQGTWHKSSIGALAEQVLRRPPYDQGRVIGGEGGRGGGGKGILRKSVVDESAS